MWTVLFPESSASRFSRIYRCKYSKEREPHRGTVLLWAYRYVSVQKFTKWRGWSSKRTVLEVEGTSQQGCPGSPEGQSSNGGDPQETSHPAAFSAGAKEGSRLGTCCGKLCLQRDLGRLFSKAFWGLSGGWAEAAGLTPRAEVVEMIDGPSSAPGPAAGLCKLVSHCGT